VTPKEARKYLGRVSEVKGLAFGFILGISVSLIAQILLLPLETKLVDNIVELWYLGELRTSILKELFGWGFLILLVILLGLLYYGYKRIYEIPSVAELHYVHDTAHKNILAGVLDEELGRQAKLSGHETSCSETHEKDFRIVFRINGRERLWVFVRDNILQLKCEVEKTALDLADEVDAFINKTIRNAKELALVYEELLERPVDGNGLRNYLPFLNSGATLDQVRQSIRQSDEYKKKHPRGFKEIV